MEVEEDKIKTHNNSLFNSNLNIFKPSDLQYKDIIGIGGFGKVSIAHFLTQKFAVKTININRPNLLAKELFTLKYLNHPNIPALYGITESHHSETIGIVYEYINGDTLINFIQNNKLSEIEILFHLIDLANVLIYLHRVGLIHRDLKPENIMIDKNNLEIKLIDFGTSKFKRNSHTLSMIQGTYMYMAPELFTSQTDSIINCTIEKCYVSDKVDIFSFGVIMNEIFGDGESYNNDPLHIMGYWLSGGKFKVSNKMSNNKIKILIRKCTQNNPRRRPKIFYVKHYLQKILLELINETGVNYFNKFNEKQSNIN
jgi:serine/threonine protein kinase